MRLVRLVLERQPARQPGERDVGLGAAKAFEGALELYPNDGPANVYRERLQLLVANPPADDWDGVWNLTEK